MRFNYIFFLIFTYLFTFENSYSQLHRYSNTDNISEYFEDQELIFDWHTSTLELYDLATDPGEMTELFVLDSPEVAELWVLLEPRIQMMAEIVGEEPDWPVLK